eukprot:scaffold186313_cov34-Prasinocladus_malaysianus.AAC.1
MSGFTASSRVYRVSQLLPRSIRGERSGPGRRFGGRTDRTAGSAHHAKAALGTVLFTDSGAWKQSACGRNIPGLWFAAPSWRSSWRTELVGSRAPYRPSV